MKAVPVIPVTSVVEDPWCTLRQYTDARIGLGRCGVSLPVSQCLDLRLAHARARDAVWMPFDKNELSAGFAKHNIDCLTLASSATSKNEFLARPDKGRCLSATSRKILEEYSKTRGGSGADICLVISNGLSARAVNENALLFAVKFLAGAREAGLGATPVTLVENGRVAVADDVAALLQAQLAVILIGERPGLSSPNSMGVYVTYAPTPGCTDDARNCISNVRSGGLSIDAGVRKLCYLVQNAFARKYSGVRLKDDMPADYQPFSPLAPVTQPRLPL